MKPATKTKRLRGKPGHYIKLCLKYKPEYDLTGGQLVTHKNPHSATAPTMDFAIGCLFKLLIKRNQQGKVWRAQMYQQPGNILLLDWKEGQHLIKPQRHAQTA